MKNLIFILALAVTSLLTSCSETSTKSGQTINPLIGDISFESRFSQQPTATTDEDLRIKTHLAYVENLLRQKNSSQLTLEKQEKRKQILDFLHEYWTAGIFPRNYDHPEKRVPCFIDKDGKICAVGYLVEQTAGRDLAEKINDGHKYDVLLAMNNPQVDNWIKTSGLSEEEFAMIQPTYGPPPTNNYNYISPEFGTTSAVLGGVNFSLSTINAIQIAQGSTNKTVPVIGLLTGAGSIINGALNFPEEKIYNGYTPAEINESQKMLAMFNIGFGTTTMVLSAWNLATNRQKKEKSVSWNLYSFPTPEKQPGFGFSLTKKL